MSRTHHHSKSYWKGHKRRLYDNGGWATREPKFWRKIWKHKKRRARTRRAEHEALSKDPEEILFPLDKKPWIYFF